MAAHLRARAMWRAPDVARVVAARESRSIPRFPEDGNRADGALQVEKRFMEWMLRDDARAGSQPSTSSIWPGSSGWRPPAIREFLNRFQRFGLIEKRPNAGWVFKGFTIELRRWSCSRSGRCSSCARRNAFAALPADAAAHLAAARGPPARSILPCSRTIECALPRLLRPRQPLPSSRSIRPSRTASSTVSTTSSRSSSTITTSGTNRMSGTRNEVAIKEHLVYIEALFGTNASMVELACRAHLASAKQTLIRATSGEEALSRSAPRRSRLGRAPRKQPEPRAEVIGQRLIRRRQRRRPGRRGPG